MATAKKTETIEIKPANIQRLEFKVTGTSPLMQQRMWKKQPLMDSMAAGSTAKSKKKREPRDFDRDCEQSLHKSTEGWIGLPAAAFRNACIDVCRMVNFKMTHAKMSIFIEEDGYDSDDGQPLVKLDAGKYERCDMVVRNDSGGADVRSRPMWRKWSLTLRIRYDADQFTASDVANLLERAGMQVGIGEGRPFSKKSNGMGYGTFTVTKGGKKNAA